MGEIICPSCGFHKAESESLCPKCMSKLKSQLPFGAIISNIRIPSSKEIKDHGSISNSNKKSKLIQYLTKNAINNLKGDKTPPKVWLPYINFLLICIVISMIYFSYPVYLGFESKSWDTTEGTIISNYIEAGQVTRAKKGVSSSYIIFNAEYNYSFNGLNYESNKFTATPYSVKHISEIETLQLEYSVGKKVDVFYNPKNPKQSVLKTGVTNRGFLPLFILGIFGILLQALKKGKANSKF